MYIIFYKNRILNYIYRRKPTGVYYRSIAYMGAMKQRWSRGHKARGQGQGVQECSRTRPRTQAQVLSKKKKVFTKTFQAISKRKKKKKRSSQKFFKCSVLTIQKIVLSSSRRQANFRGLEASRPRTSSRTPPLL